MRRIAYIVLFLTIGVASCAAFLADHDRREAEGGVQSE